MSLTAVRPYFKTQLGTLGYKEHKDAFNVENVPSQALAKTYQLNIGSPRQVMVDQQSINIQTPVTLTMYGKAAKDTTISTDAAFEMVEEVVTLLMRPTNRLTQTFKNLLLLSVEVVPIDESNDNAIEVRMNFEVHTILSFKE
jgi:hypothetical protein